MCVIVKTVRLRRNVRLFKLSLHFFAEDPGILRLLDKKTCRGCPPQVNVMGLWSYTASEKVWALPNLFTRVYTRLEVVWIPSTKYCGAKPLRYQYSSWSKLAVVFSEEISLEIKIEFDSSIQVYFVFIVVFLCLYDGCIRIILRYVIQNGLWKCIHWY